MPSKPIKISLFHAEWCGHCVNFMPVWKQMTAEADKYKNISFEEHEESTIDALPEPMRTIDGRDVRSFGYPSIKVVVNNDEYLYSGNRTPEAIYGSIVQILKESLNTKQKGGATVQRLSKNDFTFLN